MIAKGCRMQSFWYGGNLCTVLPKRNSYTRVELWRFKPSVSYLCACVMKCMKTKTNSLGIKLNSRRFWTLPFFSWLLAVMIMIIIIATALSSSIVPRALQWEKTEGHNKETARPHRAAGQVRVWNTSILTTVKWVATIIERQSWEGGLEVLPPQALGQNGRKQAGACWDMWLRMPVEDKQVVEDVYVDQTGAGAASPQWMGNNRPGRKSP